MNGFLVSLIRGSEPVAVTLVPTYDEAVAFCKKTTPCNSRSKLLDTPEYKVLRQALKVGDCEPGADVPGYGWEIVGFVGGTAVLTERWTIVSGGSTIASEWVAGEYEPI